MLPKKIAGKIHEMPSEKTTETLFVSNAFHFLKTQYPSLKFSLFAPSQTDEDELGYDARFLGASFAFEVLIQFKKASFDNNIFTMETNRKLSKAGKVQHEILHSYPHRTAFYVAPTFQDYRTLSQKESLGSEDFLDQYVAVDARKLEIDTSRIIYQSDIDGKPNKAGHLKKYKRIPGAKPLHRTQDWLLGSELFKFFLVRLLIPKMPRTSLQFFVGSFVKFTDEYNSAARFYNSEDFVERFSLDRLITPDATSNIRGDYTDINPKSLSTGTGTYIIRVYFPQTDN